MRVVVDTNVWVSGVIIPQSTPGKVLQAVRSGRLEAVASWALAEEIIEVLQRPALRRKYEISDQDIADILVVLSPLLPTIELEVAVRDPDDAPVVAAAISGNAAAIVTGDNDLLEDQALKKWLKARGVLVLSPNDLLPLIPET